MTHHTGRRLSLQTRMKISWALKSKHRKGRALSAITKAKMAMTRELHPHHFPAAKAKAGITHKLHSTAHHKSLPMSAATKAKMVAGRKLHPHPMSTAHKLAMSVARKGKHYAHKTPLNSSAIIPIPVPTIPTGITPVSINNG